MLGIIMYMSPEQVKAEPLDSHADPFSFSSVWHEMAMGHPPIEFCCRSYYRDSEGCELTTALAPCFTVTYCSRTAVSCDNANAPTAISTSRMAKS